MIVAFDASVLVLLFDENARAPKDPATGAPVDHGQARVNHLIFELQRAKAKIVIPAPALGEILVHAGSAGPQWLNILSTSRHFRIAPFDERAAVEYAAMEQQRAAVRSTPRPGGRGKAKFDEQIVAIARVEQASVIYSDDGGIEKLARPGIDVRGLASLPLPPSEAQGYLEFETNIEDDLEQD